MIIACTQTTKPTKHILYSTTMTINANKVTTKQLYFLLNINVYVQFYTQQKKRMQSHIKKTTNKEKKNSAH